MYKITREDCEQAQKYALDKRKTKSGKSWENTLFSEIKSDANQFTVGDTGEELVRIVMNNICAREFIVIDKSNDSDLRDVFGNFHEVKTSFNLNGKFFCNQIRFETVSNKNVLKPWVSLFFVLCDGHTIQIWNAQRSKELRKFLKLNNDYSWAGPIKNLESSKLWTKIAEGSVQS